MPRSPEVPFCLVEGLLVEPLGEVWVAFSPASGETTMLNNESAAILEILRDAPGDPATVSAVLAADCGVPVEELALLLDSHWSRLVSGGFIRRRGTADRPSI